MTTIEAPSANTSDIVDREQKPIDVIPHLQGKLEGAIVASWDSDTLGITERSDTRMPVDSALLITVQTVDGEGSRPRYIEINGDHRPFPQDVIDILGAPADAKREARREKTLFMTEQTIPQMTRIICSNNYQRRYIR